MGKVFSIEHELQGGVPHPNPPVGGFHPNRDLLSLYTFTASHKQKPY
jgi:hypothetical protein